MGRLERSVYGPVLEEVSGFHFVTTDLAEERARNRQMSLAKMKVTSSPAEKKELPLQSKESSHNLVYMYEFRQEVQRLGQIPIFLRPLPPLSDEQRVVVLEEQSFEPPLFIPDAKKEKLPNLEDVIEKHQQNLKKNIFERLSPNEEVVLGRAVQLGKKAKESINTGDLSEEQKGELDETIATAEIAKQIFIQTNLRLAEWVVRKFYYWKGFDREDMKQDGYEGLIKAVEGFNPDMENRFSSYAVKAIRNTITKALTDNLRSIRYSSDFVKKIYEYGVKAEELKKQHKREVTFEEVTTALGYSEQVSNSLRTHIKNNILSLDQSMSEDGGDENWSLYDVVENEEASTQLRKVVDNNNFQDLVKSVRSELGPRQRILFDQLYDEENDKFRTGLELAVNLNITHQGVSLLLKKIRKVVEKYKDTHINN